MPRKMIDEPTKYDAVFGRGGSHNRLRADSFFRKAIVKHWEDYCGLEKSAKVKRAFVSEKFINPTVKRGGRFLYRQGGKDGKWKELHPYDNLDLKEIYQKISQSLRDMKKECIRSRGAAAVKRSLKQEEATETTGNGNDAPSFPSPSRSPSPPFTTEVTPAPVTPTMVTPPVSLPGSRRSSFHKDNDESPTSREAQKDELPFTVDSLMTLADARGILQDFELDEDFPVSKPDDDAAGDFMTEDMDQEMCQLLSIEHKILDTVAATTNVIGGSNSYSYVNDNINYHTNKFFVVNSNFNNSTFISDFAF